MAVPSVTNTFANNTTADATQVNTNFSDLVTYLSNRNDGSATWDRLLVTSASAVPLIANNSTGTANIANFQDNGSNVFQIIDGGNVYMNSTKKLFLDGGSDSYFFEESADVVDFFTGATRRLRLDSGGVTSYQDLFVQPAKKFFLDGGTDTYLIESAANTIDFFAGGVSRLTIGTSLVVVNSGRDFAVATNQKIYLDGGTDTYFVEGAGNRIDIVSGATIAARVDDSAVAANTRFMIYDVDNATLERVTVGAADTGGAGFKVLRIPN